MKKGGPEEKTWTISLSTMKSTICRTSIPEVYGLRETTEPVRLERMNSESLETFRVGILDSTKRRHLPPGLQTTVLYELVVLTDDVDIKLFEAFDAGS